MVVASAHFVSARNCAVFRRKRPKFNVHPQLIAKDDIAGRSLLKSLKSLYKLTKSFKEAGQPSIEYA